MLGWRPLPATAVTAVLLLWVFSCKLTDSMGFYSVSLISFLFQQNQGKVYHPQVLAQPLQLAKILLHRGFHFSIFSLAIVVVLCKGNHGEARIDFANMTALQKHAEFFDRDKDGIITPSEMFEGSLNYQLLWLMVIQQILKNHVPVKFDR